MSTRPPSSGSNFTREDPCWENIPEIIPNTIGNLQQQLDSLLQWKAQKETEIQCQYSFQAEITHTLSDFQDQLRETNSSIRSNVMNTNKQFAGVESSFDDLRSSHQDFKQELQNDAKESFQFIETKTSGYETDEEREHEAFDNTSILRESKRARLYSLSQLQSLFYKFLTRSNFKAKVHTLKTDLRDACSNHQILKGYVEKTRDEFKTELETTQSQLEETKQSLHQAHDKIKGILNQNQESSYEIETLKVKVSDFNLFQDYVTEEFDKNTARLRNVREDMRSHDQDQRELIQKEVEELNGTFNSNRKKVKKEFDELQRWSTEQAESLKEEFLVQLNKAKDHTKAMLQKMVEESTKNNEVLIDRVADQIQEKGREIEEKQKSYRKELQEIKSIIDKLDVKFQEWTQHVLKPAQIAEAKLFLLETKLKTQEEDRITDNSFFKDVIKKLIYSLEQSNCKLSVTESTFDRDPRIQESRPASFLATSPSPKSFCKSVDGRIASPTTNFPEVKGGNQNPDKMFLKRLGYLKGIVTEEPMASNTSTSRSTEFSRKPINSLAVSKKRKMQIWSRHGERSDDPHVEGVLNEWKLRESQKNRQYYRGDPLYGKIMKQQQHTQQQMINTSMDGWSPSINRGTFFTPSRNQMQDPSPSVAERRGSKTLKLDTSLDSALRISVPESTLGYINISDGQESEALNNVTDPMG